MDKTYDNCTDIQKQAIDRFIGYLQQEHRFRIYCERTEIPSYSTEELEVHRGVLRDKLADPEILEVVMFYTSAISADEMMFKAVDWSQWREYTSEDFLRAWELQIALENAAGVEYANTRVPAVGEGEDNPLEKLMGMKPSRKGVVVGARDGQKLAEQIGANDVTRPDEEHFHDEIHHTVNRGRFGPVHVLECMDKSLSAVRQYVTEVMGPGRSNG